MPRAFDNDFDWQRGLIPDIKRVLANYLIVEAPAEEDMLHGTDLIVLKLDTIRVACRLRRYAYLDRYGDEFTIRASRPRGTETELAKILAGWGDYMFYGFASPAGDALAAWFLGNLKVFRQWHSRALVGLPKGQWPGTTQANADASSKFQAYRLSDMPDGFIETRKHATVVNAVLAPRRSQDWKSLDGQQAVRVE